MDPANTKGGTYLEHFSLCTSMKVRRFFWSSHNSSYALLARQVRQFRCTKIYRVHHQNHETRLQFMFLRCLHCRSIPCVLESQNLSVKRHHIKGCRLLAPATKRRAFPRVLTKAKCFQSLGKFGVSDVGSNLR